MRASEKWSARRRWMGWGDEMRIKVFLGCRWWTRTTHTCPQGERLRRACDMKTWHKFNWRKEELATLKTAFNHLVFTNYTHAEKKNDELMSHVVLLWNARCRHWSPSPLYPVSGLLLIAIGSTAAHTRDPLITHPFSECPSVIQLMQSFMWPFRSILPEEKQSKGVTRLGPNIGFMASLLWLFRYLKFNSRLLTICRWNGNFHWNLCSNATLTHGDSAVAALKTGTFDLKMGETMF